MKIKKEKSREDLVKELAEIFLGKKAEDDEPEGEEEEKKEYADVDDGSAGIDEPVGDYDEEGLPTGEDDEEEGKKSKLFGKKGLNIIIAMHNKNKKTM